MEATSLSGWVRKKLTVGVADVGEKEEKYIWNWFSPRPAPGKPKTAPPLARDLPPPRPRWGPGRLGSREPALPRSSQRWLGALRPRPVLRGQPVRACVGTRLQLLGSFPDVPARLVPPVHR